MSTNDETEVTEAPAAEPSQDAVADLANAKAEAEAKPPVEETAQVTNTETAEAKEEAKAEPEATLTTEPEHDLDWYKTAYDNSTKEALRLKAELDKKVETPPAPEVPAPPAPDEVLTPDLQMYVRGMISKDTAEAFSVIAEEYPVLKERETYDKFVAQAKIVGKVISETENRLPAPKELYEKTVAILGLKPDNSEAIGSAVKDAAASPRTSSAPASPPAPTKVPEATIVGNMKMYPNKTRQEIIEELEPHIN